MKFMNIRDKDLLTRLKEVVSNKFCARGVIVFYCDNPLRQRTHYLNWRKFGLNLARFAMLVTIESAGMASQYFIHVFGIAVILHSAFQQHSFALSRDSRSVFEAARSITVRIEGATLGSGVLVRREGSRYIVLTSWHVVDSHRRGEEMAIYTVDGQQHQLEQGSIKRVGSVDLAVLSFSSANSYALARIGSSMSLSIGSPVYVFGYESTGLGQIRRERAENGVLKSNPSASAPDGYQLLYSNYTLPGMSGGPLLNEAGELIGIHGRAEAGIQVIERDGKPVATGTNMGVPISYFTSALPPSPAMKPEVLDREAPPVAPLINSFANLSTAAKNGAATQADMNLYARIAAVNACIYRSAGVEFDRSVGIAGETIAQLILGQHQGLIKQVGGKSLTLEELRKASISSAVVGAYEICPKQVPSAVAAKVRDALAKR
jgi:hypothetical protein